jgi:photosystem II stability/assembly factor-like uncharacterized protein
MKQLIIVSSLHFFLSYGLTSQNTFERQKLIFQSENFNEFSKRIDDFYSHLNIEERNGETGLIKEKKLRRLQWFLSSRLGPNGSFVNYSKHNYKNYVKLSKEKTVNRSNNSYWTSEGPENVSTGIGRVDRIAFHPTDPNIIYIGTPNSGVWKTTNGGTSWTALSSYLPSLGVSGLVVDQNNPNNIYVLSGDGDSNTLTGLVEKFGYMQPCLGLYRSTDGGQNWELADNIYTNDNDFYGYDLIQAPNDSLYAATSEGLFKSSNYGSSWDRKTTNHVTDVKMAPGSNTRVYIASTNGVAYSTDGGTMFDPSILDIPLPSGTNKIKLAVSDNSASRVYALVGKTDLTAGTFGGLYHSYSYGEFFDRVRNTPNILGSNADGSSSNGGSGYSLCIDADPSSYSKIVTGNYRIWNSSNGGVNMSETTNGVHVDIHDLEYNPLDGKLYCASDGGIYVSTDHGSNWTNISSNIDITQIYHMNMFGSGNDMTIIGTQDNGFLRKNDGSSSYINVLSADGFDTDFDHSDPEKYYVSYNTRITNRGANKIAGFISPDTVTWAKNIACHNSNSDLIIIGGSDMYKTYDGGLSWDTIVGPSATWSVTACPSNSNRFYATGGVDYANSASGNAYVSSDAGSSWTGLKNNTGFPDSFTKLTDITADPTNSSRVWMTCGGYEIGKKVYYSGNAGATWTNLSGALPDIPVHAIAVTTGHDAYIGTELGVYYKADNMTDWMLFSNNLPEVPCTDLRIDETDGKIYVSTFGRGVWSSDLADNSCSNTLSLTGSFKGNVFYEASNLILLTGNVSGNAGNEVYMRSGNKLSILPGFQSSQGGYFKAYIGNCGNGELPEN